MLIMLNSSVTDGNPSKRAGLCLNIASSAALVEPVLPQHPRRHDERVGVIRRADEPAVARDEEAVGPDRANGVEHALASRPFTKQRPGRDLDDRAERDGFAQLRHRHERELRIEQRMRHDQARDAALARLREDLQRLLPA